VTNESPYDNFKEITQMVRTGHWWLFRNRERSDNEYTNCNDWFW